MELGTYRRNCKSAKIFHFVDDVSFKVDMSSTFYDFLFEVVERELIAIFVLAIVGTILLNCIVCQVDKVIV